MENETTTSPDVGNSSVVGGTSGTTSVDSLTLTLVGADGFICLFGLLGNVLVIYVIRRSSSKSKAVTTNTFILNLSISASGSSDFDGEICLRRRTLRPRLCVL